MKILGLPRNCADDTFVFKLNRIVQGVETLSPTKQDVLSGALRISLGLFLSKLKFFCKIFAVENMTGVHPCQNN